MSKARQAQLYFLGAHGYAVTHCRLGMLAFAVVVFGYERAIVERYPSIVGGVIVGRDVRNGPSPDELRERFAEEQGAVRGRIGSTPLSELQSLAAWRKAFRGFGVDPTQYRCAAEALLRRLTKSGDIPCISLLVDLGNLVSIRHAIPTAVFDLDKVAPPVTVRFASGSETFHDIGQSISVHPEAGEVVFCDANDVVVARRWCWRQSEEGATRSATANVVMTIEAHHESARADVEAAMADLQGLLKRYASGAIISGVLDARSPSFVAE